VVDAGALIRLEQLHGLADEFWTVKEVVAEVRDKRARNALKALPFELQTREPSEEALAAVVAFAKKTGDLSVLSKPDIRIVALTYMLHKETHGVSSLLTEPLLGNKPGDEKVEEESDDEGGSEKDGESENEDREQQQRTQPVPTRRGMGLAPVPEGVAIAELGKQKTGVSWAAALKEKKSEAPVQSAPEPAAVIPQVAPSVSSSMWDDDDFAGVSSQAQPEEDSSKEAEQPASSSNPVAEEWPSLGISDKTETDRFLSVKEEIGGELEAIEAKAKKIALKKAKKLAKKQKELEKAAAAAAAEQLNLGPEKPSQAPLTGSRLLGVSGVRVDCGELDDEGWITSENIFEVDPLESVGRANAKRNDGPVRPKAQDHEVACVTTDYAMQNVMIQMQLRLVTLEGRAVTTIRRFVLKCDACAAICRNLEKRFCPSCGNNTLARLSYSISPEGVLTYHYKKGRRVNTRGLRYSLPKPNGGRTGDLLLSEDQLLTGWWSQQVRKKSSSTSMFGEHVTESLGLQFQSRGEGIRVGYGRQNPNAARGRERRGKKKKRNEKKPGHL